MTVQNLNLYDRRIVAREESVTQLFDGDPTGDGQLSNQRKCFVIKDYQRGVSWEKRDIERMLADISFAMEQGWDEYFLGSITLMQQRPDRYEVIDGQQRITALTLILNGIVERLSAPASSSHPRLVELITKLIGKPPLVHKLHYKNSDEEANYISIIRTGEPVRGITHLNELHASIRAFFSSQRFEENDAVRVFAEYLLQNTTMVVIRARDARLTHQIFETLNSSGKKLEAIDLIRNKIFYALQDGEVLEKAGIWKRLREDFIEHTGGNTKSIDKKIQELFKTDLRVRYGKWLDENELPSYLEGLIRKGDAATAGRLVDEICSKESFQSFHRLRASNDCMNFTHRELPEVIGSLNTLEMGLPLAYTMLHMEFPVAIVVKNLRLIDAFIKRYWVTKEKLPIKGIGEFLCHLAQEITCGSNATPPENTHSLIRERMIGFDNTKDQLLNDRTFVSKLEIQQQINDKKAKHILLSMAQFESRRTNGIFDTSIDATIEHILPKDWPVKTSGWNHFDSETHQSNYRRLGNLMLLTGQENEECDQEAFAVKKMIYQRSVWYPSSEVSAFERWNIENIQARQKLIANKLLDVWKI